MAAAVSPFGAVNSVPQIKLKGSSGCSSALFGTSLKKAAAPAYVPKFSPGKLRVVAEAEVDEKKQTDKDRWKGLVTDVSDDQQDITRGKGMADRLY